MLKEPSELLLALSKAQGAIADVEKDKENPFLKTSYATLASIRRACRDALAQNSLCIIQSPGTDEKGLFVETTLGHASGESITSKLHITPVKNDPQGIGSAITYMRRYAIQAMLGIAASDDDDGEIASGRHEGAYEPSRQASPDRGADSRSTRTAAPKAPVTPRRTWRDVIWHRAAGKVTQGDKADQPYVDHSLGWIAENDLEGLAYWIEHFAAENPDPKNEADAILVRALAAARKDVMMTNKSIPAKALAAPVVNSERAEVLKKLNAILTTVGKSEIWMVALLQEFGKIPVTVTSFEGVPTEDLHAAILAESFIQTRASQEAIYQANRNQTPSDKLAEDLGGNQ